MTIFHTESSHCLRRNRSDFQKGWAAPDLVQHFHHENNRELSLLLRTFIRLPIRAIHRMAHVAKEPHAADVRLIGKDGILKELTKQPLEKAKALPTVKTKNWVVFGA
jgi:hypothetical protein